MFFFTVLLSHILFFSGLYSSVAQIECPHLAWNIRENLTKQLFLKAIILFLKTISSAFVFVKSGLKSIFSLKKWTSFCGIPKGIEDIQFGIDKEHDFSDNDILLCNCSTKDHHEFAIVRENIKNKLEASYWIPSESFSSL